MDAADQQVRFRLVGRQEHGAAKLRHRVSILLALEQPAAAIEMELRGVPLVALRGVDYRQIDARLVARLEILADALEAARQRIERRVTRALGISRRQLRRRARAPSPASTVLPGRVEREREHDVRIRCRRDCAAAPHAASRWPPADR